MVDAVVSGWHLRRAARIARDGGIIAYPTEGVYGLGCDPRNEPALQRLIALKGRAAAKGLILIGATVEQIMEYAQPPEGGVMKDVLAAWPGPVTWILRARDDVPELVRGGRDTVAVRVTAHCAAAALCRSFGGALVSTSANPSGRRPARTALAVRRWFGDALDYLVNDRPGDLRGGPTEIRDAASGRLLRPRASVL